MSNPQNVLSQAYVALAIAHVVVVRFRYGRQGNTRHKEVLRFTLPFPKGLGH